MRKKQVYRECPYCSYTVEGMMSARTHKLLEKGEDTVFTYEVKCDACNSVFYYKEPSWGKHDESFTRKTPPGDGSTVANFNEHS